ncbi:6-pyruvoyl trahydropterin synthase family protein [Haliangium sp.]|uniref:6-pyruvoyl trahydropterin synthase family protein n=1 Tax=Haliangium sp. TaxID=2663208 RepID=UPI003D11BAE3
MRSPCPACYTQRVPASYRISVARAEFKFSCAHMTVFPDGSKERLHGHNYFLGLALELRDVAFANMIPFAPIKEAAAGLCREWKEHLLLATGNPHFELIAPPSDGADEADDEMAFRLCGARYVVPRADVILLPIDNVAVEPLAAHAAERLAGTLADLLRPDLVSCLEVEISEGPGQGALCRYPIG